MNVNGVDYDFGRMLKVVLWRAGTAYGAGSASNVKYVIEYCPYRKEGLCSRIDVNVTDLPSPSQDDKPGYTADVVLYNPPRDLLEIIAQNATWIFKKDQLQELQGATPQRIEQAITNNLKDFYNSRLQISVYAGYWTPPASMTEEQINARVETEDIAGTSIGYVNIFHGYVNETSCYRAGTDDILTIRAHDIDVSKMDNNVLFKTVEDVLDSQEEIQQTSTKSAVKGYTSWDKTFKEIVTLAAPASETVFYEPGGVAHAVGKDFVSPQTGAQANIVFNGHYKVYYVKSKAAFEKRGINKLSQITPDLIDVSLKTQMESVGWWTGKDHLALPAKNHMPGTSGLPDWEKFVAYGDTREQKLKSLCTFSNAGVTYHRVSEPIDNKIVYLVYRMGASTGKMVEASKADIKIYNYQNLLEAPTIAGNAQMTIKMLFNPVCRCWLNIALMFDKELTEEFGFVNVSGLETSMFDSNGNMVGSLKANTGLGNAFAGIQLSSSMSALSQRLTVKDTIRGGYMFNTGFPICKVVHKLSTHTQDWTTTVTTTPSLQGIKVGK